MNWNSKTDSYFLGCQKAQRLFIKNEFKVLNILDELFLRCKTSHG